MTPPPPAGPPPAGPPRVVVLDYGSGNLRSAQRALAAAGAEVAVTADLAAAADADGLVVPGVGAFAACQAGIDALGAGPVIAARVAAGRPVLGICVGAQVLFEYGDEHGVVTKGLGLLPGGVTRLPGASGRSASEARGQAPGPSSMAGRVPHMGWNTVQPPPGSVLFGELPAGSGQLPERRFYFVHSYAARPTPALAATGAAITVTDHGGPFVAAVELGALSATQFHPEKSGAAGAALLRAWVGTLSGTGDRNSTGAR